MLMTQLSVNVNKIATLRNTRDSNIPDLLHVTRLALKAGARGITIHPRPDQRHIRAGDVGAIAELVKQYPNVELNMEGNPFLGRYVDHAREVRPTQCTLVPDSPEAPTSDHGWDLRHDGERVKAMVEQLKSLGCRVSLFMDAASADLALARQAGADRVEFYTGPYAHDFVNRKGEESAQRFAASARQAQSIGLGVNAGHDLNLANLPLFLRTVPDVLEVSIGHALIADALEFGMAETVRRYRLTVETDRRKR